MVALIGLAIVALAASPVSARAASTIESKLFALLGRQDELERRVEELEAELSMAQKTAEDARQEAVRLKKQLDLLGLFDEQPIGKRLSDRLDAVEDQLGETALTSGPLSIGPSIKQRVDVLERQVSDIEVQLAYPMHQVRVPR